MEIKKIKILFFIGSLNSGGKERRLLELMTYLNKADRYTLILVTKQSEVMFDNFFDLKVEWISLKSKKLNLGSFLEFFRIANKVSPDFIHTWGNKQTLIALPFKFLKKNSKLVNSQITSAPPSLSWGENLISQINFRFSDCILSNSYAGIEAYLPPTEKSKVIYNGLNLKRFENLPQKKEIREKYGILSKYAVIMVATYSKNKDYERFFLVGRALTKLRDDTTFLGIGFYENTDSYFQKALEISDGNPLLKPMPGTKEVEALVNACDIGCLFSNTEVHGEGISNAIIEYMALGKPVIANDAGGTKEIVRDQWNGYLIQKESPEQIAEKISFLLDSPLLMQTMGARSKEKILEDFTLDRMGKEFENVYQSLSK